MVQSASNPHLMVLTPYEHAIGVQRIQSERAATLHSADLHHAVLVFGVRVVGVAGGAHTERGAEELGENDSTSDVSRR